MRYSQRPAQPQVLTPRQQARLDERMEELYEAFRTSERRNLPPHRGSLQSLALHIAPQCGGATTWTVLDRLRSDGVLVQQDTQDPARPPLRVVLASAA